MLGECSEKVFDRQVSIEGCDDITIRNRKCLELCNSYYDPLMEMFLLCFSCLPNVEPFEMTVRCARCWWTGKIAAGRVILPIIEKYWIR